MLVEFTANKLAIVAIIIPNILGKLPTILIGISAIATIIIQILDSVVEQKKNHAKASYKFWENNSSKIKFLVVFISNISILVRSIQVIFSSSF
ncbi:MAG: hypothetical protein F6K40_04260 [Okeania sp. SIO3I5]|uniref:hypothetical protein n=1 Tax=Okeania sp. SIO3I5 TaxID=2607805 RepID=UPI0013BBA69C|nr:hypothetical protein [Okeania sp. SIO3I5]NEQ35554.1 hypothetical protein [Okeania sp. SIO3I5]